MDASPKTGAMHQAGRGRLYDSIVDAFGDTPIVRLRRLPDMHGVNATGEVFLSHTKLNDKLTLRLSIGNIRTTERHVRRAWWHRSPGSQDGPRSDQSHRYSRQGSKTRRRRCRQSD